MKEGRKEGRNEGRKEGRKHSEYVTVCFHVMFLNHLVF
jgi:hypothetical protein